MTPHAVRHKPATLARTHCAQGHALTPENLYQRKNHAPHCRLCDLAASKASRLRNQAAHAALYS
jgi:hypothetical protein